MEPVVEPTEDLPARLAAATPEERERLLRETVLSRVSEVLSRPSMDDDSNFLQNGLTSLTALELAKNLMNLTEVEVPLVAVVENPTAALLGKYIFERYEAGLDAGGSAAV
jgi:aryl carrier-like protein